MKQFKHKVYVKRGKFGWVASYVENDQFIEVRGATLPKVEGYYYVYASEGFKKWQGKNSNKYSIYCNGDVEFIHANKRDLDLEA